MWTELFYVSLGVLFLVIQMFIHEKLRKMEEPIFSLPNLCFLICNAAIIFTLMWIFGSLREYEVQAAFMGIVFYAGVGILFGILGYKMLMKKQNSQS